MKPTDQNTDNDLKKGATEDEAAGEKSMTSMSGQLGHRDQDPLLKSSDSDFPEPGESPEHMGQFKERNRKDQDTRFGGVHDPERRGGEDETKPVEGGPDQPTEEPEKKVAEPVHQDPGHKQNQDQGDKKDDEVAA
ncbi:MAG TPA: hypothetical protein VL382_04460 [Terriglobales bacterium]|nr:hypothetical protein [Terriglobales bacterium]